MKQTKATTKQVLEGLIADFFTITIENIKTDEENPFKSKKHWQAWKKDTKVLLDHYATHLKTK